MLCKIPRAVMVDSTEDPPYVTKTKGTPVMGKKPVIMPALTKTCMAKYTVMPAEVIGQSDCWPQQSLEN